jgi:hypothetical protein
MHMNILGLSFLAAAISLLPCLASARPVDNRAEPLVVLTREGRTKFNFRVSIDGQVEAVHNTAQGYFCQFEMSKPVTVTVSCDEDVRTVDIRPKSKRIKSVVSGRDVKFQLDAPAKLSFEINENLENPLYLFADGIERRAVNPDDPNVKYYRGNKVYKASEIVLKDNQSV